MPSSPATLPHLTLLPPGGAPDPLAAAFAAQAVVTVAREGAIDAALTAHTATRLATRSLPAAERVAARRIADATCLASIEDALTASRAAHFRRQQDDSLALLAGWQAELEERAAFAPQGDRTASEVLADLSAAIDHAEARS